jgi:hypothetical protein
MVSVDHSAVAVPPVAVARRLLHTTFDLFAFAVVPAGLFLDVLISAAMQGVQSYGLEFRGNLWRPGTLILHGRSPYEPHRLDALAAAVAHGHRAHDADTLAQAVYPAATHVAATPFALIPFQPAMALYVVLSVAAIVGALWILGVRDWRCYGIVFASLPVIQGVKLGGLTPFLLLALAVLWRFRDDVRRSALAGTAMIAAKLFLWPMIVWQFGTGRRTAARWSIVGAGAATVVAWALIDFHGMTGYPHLLATLTHLEQHHGESLTAFGSNIGLGATSSRALAGVFGIAFLLASVVLGRRGADAAAYGVALAAAFMLTPIVWPQYFMLAFVPIAIARPRLSVAWMIPIVAWVVPEAADAPAAQALYQAILLASVAVAVRGDVFSRFQTPSNGPIDDLS